MNCPFRPTKSISIRRLSILKVRFAAIILTLQHLPIKNIAAMTSKQGRKRKSEEMDGTPAAITPPNSPLKKMKITQTQKQALIDNLQLEREYCKF